MEGELNRAGDSGELDQLIQLSVVPCANQAPLFERDWRLIDQSGAKDLLEPLQRRKWIEQHPDQRALTPRESQSQPRQNCERIGQPSEVSRVSRPEGQPPPKAFEIQNPLEQLDDF